MPRYNPAEIEPKWQADWEEQQLYATEDAFKLVMEEGVPFREAYKRIGARIHGKGKGKGDGGS